MLEHERTGLRNVTLEACLVLSEKQRATAFDLLRQTGSTAFDRSANVRIMTIRATHLSFEHWMMVRHFKSRADFEVALETGVRRSSRINNFALIATSGDMEASRAVA